MVGFKKWYELIHASDIELELAEFLLRRFKNAQDVQDWEETVLFAGLADLEPETKLDYARQYYELGDKAAIVNHPTEQITILFGKLKTAELNKFSDKNNPEGILRKSSYVFCTHCNKAFNFTQSKVIKENEKDLHIVALQVISKIKEAINVAQGKEFVEKMENTYDAHIARGGTNVSGGQKQRLAIARAIVNNPKIIMKTDNRKLFEFSIMEFNNYNYKIEELSLDMYNDDIKENVQTEYEKRFHEKGFPIYKISVKK